MKRANFHLFSYSDSFQTTSTTSWRQGTKQFFLRSKVFEPQKTREAMVGDAPLPPPKQGGGAVGPTPHHQQAVPIGSCIRKQTGPYQWGGVPSRHSVSAQAGTTPGGRHGPPFSLVDTPKIHPDAFDASRQGVRKSCACPGRHDSPGVGFWPIGVPVQ